LSSLKPGHATTLHHSSSDPHTGWVLYDADCGVCTRLASFWGPTLARLGLATAPLQSQWVSERTGLALADLLTDVRLLETDGTLISGPNVYRYVMRRLWWAYPLFLLSKAPGLSRVFDWGYRAFARHRTRISATCGLPGTP
jgi:predicted DCC family thiol-disulfide oxidoreductase YuxK